eukprot:3818877-Rhodomonas_salina.1
MARVVLVQYRQVELSLCYVRNGAVVRDRDGQVSWDQVARGVLALVGSLVVALGVCAFATGPSVVIETYVGHGCTWSRFYFPYVTANDGQSPRKRGNKQGLHHLSACAGRE